VTQRRFGLRRLVIAGVGLVLVAYLGAIVWLVLNETRLVFQAGRPLGESRPRSTFTQIDIPRSDAARQIAWSLTADTPDRRTWVLFLHGNGATIASRVNISHYEQLRALGANVLAPEYRGFSGLAGIPSEQSVTEDARAAYDYLARHERVPPEQIVIYGWSLGSAIAVALAADVESAGVILEGAPASLVAIGQQEYPYFPISLIMRNTFASIERIGRIKVPLLFLHSPEDTVVPIAEGRRLQAAAHAPTTFVEVSGGHVHASEVDAEHFYAAIRAFLASRRLLGD
jgi:pimeloyl-ACP methyl ester carboxylesterase